MEQQQPSWLREISPGDWEKTPSTVKLLLRSLDARKTSSENKNYPVRFLDAVPIAIAIYNPTGQIVYLNQKARDLLNLDRDSKLKSQELTHAFQVYREGTQQLCPIESLPSTLALAGKTVLTDDLEIHSSGRAIPVEILATPIYNERQQITDAVVTFRDIGDRKRRQLEQQILENTLKSESRYRQVLQAQTDIVVRSLPDTTITFANDAFCSAYSESLENVLGQKWSRFVPSENLAPLCSQVAALSPERPTFENIARYHRADNQTGWTQWVNRGIFDRYGQLIEIQSVGRDITALQEQIQREQALNRVFQAIRNSLDLEKIFTTATAETARMLEVSNCRVAQYLAERGIWRHLAEYRQSMDTPSAIGLEIPDAGNPFAARLKQLQIVSVEDTSNLKDEINRELARTFSGAWLLIPLTVEGVLWGCFSLSTTLKPYTWNDERVKLARAVAEQLEVAIQQANLYQRAQLELAERCRVETELRKSNAFRQQILENMAEGLCVCCEVEKFPYVRFTVWNRQMEAITGYTIEEINSLGRHQSLYPDLEVRERAIARMEQMREGKNLKAEEWEIQRQDGQRCTVEISTSILSHDDGQVYVLALMQDITKRKQTERKLAESESKFRSIFDHAAVGIIYGSLAERYPKLVSCNSRFCQMLGYTASELSQLTAFDITHPDDRGVFSQPELISGEIPCFSMEKRYLRRDGTVMWAHTTVSLLKGETGKPLNTVVVVEDISDRKQAEAALRESEARYRLVAENMNDLVCLHDLDGRYLYVSPSCTSLLGYSHAEMLGRDAYEFFHPEDCDRIRQVHLEALEGKPTPITYRMRQRSGSYIWFETLTKPIIDSAGRVIQLLTTSRDVTERIQIQDQLRHDALHDTLTGLPNRALLMKRLELAINRAKRHQQYRFAILFLDLDRFKIINDSLGHIAGDQLLIFVAQKLQSILRATDLAVRLGGDEFVMLLEDVQGTEEAVRVAKRIFTELQTPPIIEGRTVYTTPSIGIVLGDKNYSQASHILRNADIAMYRAKAKGKARYEIFDRQMHDRALNRLNLENDLRRALEEREFLLYYQPIVALETKALVGFEALIRWQHPTLGLRTPDEFIAIAQETGLITPISSWVLYTSCSQLASWQKSFSGLSALKVNINLSAQDLQRPDLLDEIDRVLKLTGLDGRCLTLEITEGMLIKDIESTLALLSQLKARGVRISIDDFGTGYSSLSYLHRLPANSLKVDRSFVNQLQAGERKERIVATIVALSHQLELDAIAEGIETQTQLERLQRLGYKFGQGYYFSKPLDREAATVLLATNHTPYNNLR